MVLDFKEANTARCPLCKTVSIEKVWAEPSWSGFQVFFVCKNPICEVEKIYTDNAVEILVDEK